ncbi:MAG: hypothetical protein ACLQU3_09665 [Limisphaerales bacterium]
MNTGHKKGVRNLREAVLDNSKLSAAEIRQRLTDDGVDVDQFLKGVDEAFRRGLQEGVRQKAAQAKAQATVLKGSLLGDLAGKSREALLELCHAATGGQYGAEVMARCRNKNAEGMTDDELRSWMEDIERLIKKK